MNEDQIAEKIITILEGYGAISEKSLEKKLAYRYLDAGHVDSFAIINLIIELEDAFGIALSPEDTQSDEFRTAGGIISIVVDRLAS